MLNKDLGIAMEMSTIGRFQEKNKSGKPRSGFIKVQVTSDSGFPQVHVHLVRTGSNALRSCVKLDKAEYFLHDKYRSKLTREQIVGLVDFFNSPMFQKFVSKGRCINSKRCGIIRYLTGTGRTKIIQSAYLT